MVHGAWLMVVGGVDASFILSSLRAMTLNDLLEWTSVGFSLVFLVLLMRENKWCWPFGMLGSGLGAWLFWSDEVWLISEGMLYIYYVIIGAYGWYKWTRGKQDNIDLPVKTWGWKQHVLTLVGGSALAFLIGWLSKTYLGSNSPYLDAHTSVFSVIASYMQAEKVLSSWHFWIVINGVTIGLYLSRGLHVYTGLMVIYFVLSIVGLLQWRRTLLSSAA